MVYCAKCGAQLPEDGAFCPTCGASRTIQATAQPIVQVTQATTARPTRAWYLVPLFLNILGGIIGYFAVRKDDPKFANRLLILGIVMFVVVILAVPTLIFIITDIVSRAISGSLVGKF